MSLQVWSCQRKGSGSTGAKLWPNVDNMPTAQDPGVWGSKWHCTGTHQAAGRLQTTSCCTGIENIGSFLSPYLSIKDLSGACGRPVERQEGGDWIHPGLWYLGWAEFDIVFVKIDCCCMTSMDYGFWRRHLVVGFDNQIVLIHFQGLGTGAIRNQCVGQTTKAQQFSPSKMVMMS